MHIHTMLSRASDLSEKALLLARSVPEQKLKSTGSLAMSAEYAGNTVAGIRSAMTVLSWHLQEARNARLSKSNRSNRCVHRYDRLVLCHSVHYDGRAGKMKYRLTMKRGKRMVVIGEFPNLYRVDLIVCLLDWDESWKPIIVEI